VNARHALVALALAALSARARAQEPAPEPLPSRQSIGLVLDDRNRSAAHPGSPLVISGNEQDGNDLRSRTPALANVARRAGEVDANALYERTLAAYEDRALFQAPPVASVDENLAEGPARSGLTGSGVLPEDVSPWPIVAGATLSAFALAWYVARPRVRRT
jgi:hypothetical protein